MRHNKTIIILNQLQERICWHPSLRYYELRLIYQFKQLVL